AIRTGICPVGGAYRENHSRACGGSAQDWESRFATVAAVVIEGSRVVDAVSSPAASEAHIRGLQDTACQDFHASPVRFRCSEHSSHAARPMNKRSAIQSKTAPWNCSGSET